MRADQHIEEINLETFQSILARYDSITPAKLVSLDEQRYTIIPAAVADRGKTAYLTKSELVTLVEWKLSHGTFRPSLKGLAKQNADEFVEEITREAFGVQDNAAALKVLVKLRGVGPATASLLLSVKKMQDAPFFSDELFRWCFFEDKPGQGWDRSIKYTSKEYADLAAQVAKLRARLAEGDDQTVPAVDVEKVAYVLGKEAENGELGHAKAPSDEVTDGTVRKRRAETIADAAGADVGKAPTRARRRLK